MPTAKSTSSGPAASRHELALMLRNLAWTVQRLVPEVADLDPLPNTELAVIKQVLKSPGVTVTELARRLGMQQSNVSAAVRALIERGLVTREPSSLDRRVSKLRPTEQSRAAVEAIDTAWSGTLRTAMAELSHEQVAAIEDAAGALRALDEVLRAGRSAQPIPRPLSYH